MIFFNGPLRRAAFSPAPQMHESVVILVIVIIRVGVFFRYALEQPNMAMCFDDATLLQPVNVLCNEVDGFGVHLLNLEQSFVTWVRFVLCRI